MPADDKNLLACGDNLDVLRRYVASESVDLVYLDPPFNSDADYNLLYKHQDGSRAAGQIKAFQDTWRWDQAAVAAYEEVVERGGDVSRAMQAFRTILGPSNMLAYLAMMAPRLVELRRVLRPTGSLYLHCDPTAAHYLKLLLDAVFRPERFGNEIVWRRSNPKSHASANFPNVTDVILRYGGSGRAKYHQVYGSHDPDYVATAYRHIDAGGRYRLLPLLNPNKNRPNLTYEFLGVTRVWRWTRERMEQAYRDGIVVQTRPGAVPQYKKYLADSHGRTVSNLWTDIEQADGGEWLPYPTQKPLALLTRIIEASTDEGDLVLDPFCGCGTAVIAAQRAKRKWIGIDITHHAIALIKSRLVDEYGLEVSASIRVIHEPTTLEDAAVLADSDAFQFQAWALGLVGARPLNGIKKGPDRGIDGHLYFHESEGGVTRQILLSVKAGHTGPAHVRDLRGVIERDNADIGVLISLAEPTPAMRAEAADAGFYEFRGKRYPRVQLRTVAELLDGRGVEYPLTAETVFRPTIWPPESIPSVPRRRRKAAKPAAKAASAPGFRLEQPADTDTARRLREDYARRAAESKPGRKKVAAEALPKRTRSDVPSD